MCLVTDHLANVPAGQRHIRLEHRSVWWWNRCDEQRAEAHASVEEPWGEARAEQKVLAEVIRGNWLAQEQPGKEELFLYPFNIQQYQMKSQDSWCPTWCSLFTSFTSIFSIPPSKVLKRALNSIALVTDLCRTPLSTSHQFVYELLRAVFPQNFHSGYSCSI